MVIMDKGFKDYFSDGSSAYRIYRPGYPKELFSYLSSLTPANVRAWDCATGNGQTALDLSNYYSEVIGTDASKNQIKHAQEKKGIVYKVEKAEQSSLEDHSVDLITVAQAMHWFDVEEFSSEVGRVLKSGGVLAAWTYGLLDIKPGINEEIQHLYGPVLDAYWPPERKMVEDGYRNITLPFEEIQPPEFHMETEWSLFQLLGYLSTWSAVKKYEAANGVNPVEQRFDKLARLWGDPEKRIRMHWPLAMRVWAKP
jgi:ubiquinone/menaquinone biosynthesis C-methylase UbiE